MEGRLSKCAANAEEAAEHLKTLTLLPILATKVNFASAQNGVAIIKSLSIENATAAAMTEIVVTMTSTPGFVREKTWRIDRIGPESAVPLYDLDTSLDTAILGGLDEAEWGKITFTLTAKGRDPQTFDQAIEMLARDEWGGLGEMANLLAAYVSPNQPYVAKILRDASTLLEGAGRSGAIDGYQSNDPSRVWMLAGAIWSAATALGLNYVVPPASFEASGQKIRSPERIASERMATCLDSSLLLAAAFEAAGLNTAVLFSKGHAWIGVWLTKNDFGHLTESDAMTVRKAMAAREFIPLESTLLTSRPSIGFEQAIEAGRDLLTETRENEFIQAVDINRARAARIRPLASHKVADNVVSTDEVESAGAALPRPLDLSQLPPDIVDPIPLAMDAEPILRSFTQWQHEELIEHFHSLDDSQCKLATEEILRRLGNTLPHRDQVPRKSELGILRHQIGLTRPSLALRSLIAELPTTFTRLAPCVLMSPLSVAQYLPAGLALFDLVIFDEASQISTWDAIGAIARGKRAIIVGDPKQMPPSNFFGRNDDNEDQNSDVAEFAYDMPSILEEVTHSGVPIQYLSWHYRSQDEALIAFSNYSYYDGRLVTFPAPKAHSDAIRHHPVNGTYLRGKGRTNPEEAQAIVTYVVDLLTQWLSLDEADRPTLGIITFNQPQQALIEDLIEAKRQANPKFEWFFADERDEPVIVRNIENIQGDERDVILFSITFGPDHAGKLPMSFGAINLSGGEKRLNVAVTRARREMHVFTSISAEHINLERSNKRGVADFKAFLDYVKRGPVALAAQDAGSLGGVDSPFEEAVMEGLRAKGWDVHTQIGVSDFRIDLAVKHPDHAGAWLAGVECDGARYHASATARDRDRVRQGVLEGLGWKIVRVWSTQWFRAKSETLEALDQALHELLELDRHARQTVESTTTTQHHASHSNAKDHRANNSIPSTDNTIIGPYTSDIAVPLSAADTSVHSAQFARGVTVSSPEAPTSTEASVSHSTKFILSADKFFDEDYTSVLQTLLADLLHNYGPITANNLAKNVSQAHGWARTGPRIRARIDALLSAFEQIDENGVIFVWEPGTVRNRVPFRGMLDRSAREISRSEIGALLDTMAHRLDDFEDPILEVARAMGIARLTGDTRSYLEECRQWHARTTA